MIISTTILAIAVLGATPKQPEHPLEPAMGREIGCVNSVPPLCVISFTALLSRSPHAYEKRTVEVVGFMRKFGSDYALFADETASRFGSLEGALLIDVDDENLRDEFSRLDKHYVRIAGALSLPRSDFANFWAELKVSTPPGSVAERRDDLPPAPPRPKDLSEQ